METGETENSKPRINEQGILIIPFESEQKYHWWDGGQPLSATLQELQVDLRLLARYSPFPVKEK